MNETDTAVIRAYLGNAQGHKEVRDQSEREEVRKHNNDRVSYWLNRIEQHVDVSDIDADWLAAEISAHGLEGESA